MNPLPTSEERVWAVLSHLSAVAFGIGLFLPILGWSEQRRKSKYASFQCLQALGYQSLGYTVWLLAYLLIVLAAMVLLIVMSFRAEASGQVLDPLEGPAVALLSISAFGFLAFYALLPIVAAVACAFGRDYRYPVLGNRLARYLGYEHTAEADSLNEANEERWVASMGHFSVIIALWGLLAPLSAWILQGRHSSFLKFQSIQTTVFQVFVTILYVLAGVFYVIGLVVVFAVLGLEGNPNLGSSAGMAGLILFFVTLLIAALIMLSVPFFHILGQYAGYRLLKGENYRYPLVGRLVVRWMAKP
ncbi:MAG TPA: DUF4870 domain-containing protein [Anaerolineales bacterium]|nr:DUF4870 domain-containing protein [Anaerolineales bacterium]